MSDTSHTCVALRLIGDAKRVLFVVSAHYGAVSWVAPPAGGSFSPVPNESDRTALMLGRPI